MSINSQYPRMSKGVRTLLTTAMIALAATGAAGLMPWIGMSTALLILPILSIAEAGWIAAGTASTLMTGVSWVGVSIIDYGSTLSLIGAIAALPSLTGYLAQFSDYLGFKNPILGKDGLFDKEYGLRTYLKEGLQTGFSLLQLLLSPVLRVGIDEKSIDVTVEMPEEPCPPNTVSDTLRFSLKGLFCMNYEPVIEQIHRTNKIESRAGLFLSAPSWYVDRRAQTDQRSLEGCVDSAARDGEDEIIIKEKKVTCCI